MILRKAVGAVVLNSKNQIIVFQRKDHQESWQGVEGGIDNNETPLEAINRELYEEVGLTKNDFDIVATRDKGFDYLFNEEGKKKYNIDGQTKYFFVIKLKNDNFKFKFDIKQDEIEFISYKILNNNNDLMDLVPSFKKGMYNEILEYFKL